MLQGTEAAVTRLYSENQIMHSMPVRAVENRATLASRPSAMIYSVRLLPMRSTTRPGSEATTAVIRPPIERNRPCIPEDMFVSTEKYAISAEVSVDMMPATM